MHGGKSLHGITSRTFVHGRYSRDGLGRMLWYFSDEAVAEQRRIAAEYHDDLCALLRAEREAREARKARRHRPLVLTDEMIAALADVTPLSEDAMWWDEVFAALASMWDDESRA